MKFDGGKNRLDLICPEIVEGIGQVLTFGAQKYSDNSWQGLDNAESRYKAALFRHLMSYLKGEKVDPESGLSHLYHMGANIMFLDYFDRQVVEEVQNERVFEEVELEVCGATNDRGKRMPRNATHARSLPSTNILKKQVELLNSITPIKRSVVDVQG